MKRKTSLIVWGAVLLLAAYGIYDLVREVRRSYTSCYAHTYSHAIGQMMGPRFDSLTPRGEGIRIGVVDAGFGGLRDDRFTRRLRVADYLDLTDGDTTGFFRDDCDHGTRVTRNIGGFSNDTLLGLACKADYYLVKSDLEHGEPREDERRLCRALAWLAQRQVDVVNISLGYTVFDDFDGYTPQMLDGRTALCSRFLDSLLDAHPRMVVVQSAGNEGKNKWRHISFPGDVAEAVTVGAADSEGTGRSGKSGTGYYPPPRQARPGGVRLPERHVVLDARGHGAVCRPHGVQADETPRADPPAARFGHPQRSARPRNGLRHPAVRHPARIPGYPR